MYIPRRLFFKITAVAGAALALAVFAVSLSGTQAQTTEQGTLTFSPSTVKNGEAFSIKLTGGPANTQTKIWVKNGTEGFQDFGTWEKTDASGNINVGRTMNCNAYTTLEPGKTVAVGNRILSQAVYLEYVGTGKTSDTTVHTKDCTASTSTTPSASPLPPPGTPRCYFYEPYGGQYHFLKYPQPDYYEGTFSTSQIGEAGNPTPVITATLKWSAVKELADRKNEPLKSSDGYTAVLSSDYANANFGIEKIDGASVDLAGNYSTKIGGDAITYKLDIKKDGNTVATCSAKATVTVHWVKQYVAPIPADVKFPGETSYSIVTSKGTSTAAYKFTAPIPNITFNQTNLKTYLGNHFKNIFWIGSRYGGGPLGRWDISDPWNPGSPETMGMIYGGSPLALGKRQPAEHRGPFSGGAWPHPPALFYQGGVLGELSSGEGRFAFGSGEEGGGEGREPRSLTPIVTLAPGQGLNWGQLFDGKWQSFFENYGTYVIDATADGKFFFFGAGGYPGYGAGVSANPLTIFDLTNLTGSVDYGQPTLGSFSSQPWQKITEMRVIEVPGIRNHFLVARSSSGTAAEKPRIYIGEVNSDTGRIVRQNSFILDVQGVAYTAPYSPMAQPRGWSNLEWASVNGKTYVFGTESFTRNGLYDQYRGTLKIAAFEFNPQQLKLVRKGDFSFKGYPTFPYSNNSDAWNLARSENGSIYPMLMVTEIDTTVSGTNSYNQAYTNPASFRTNFYSLKDFLSSTTTLSLVPEKADVVLPGDIVPHPFSVGTVVLRNLESGVVVGGDIYHVFLKGENGKSNLYMYRQAYLFDGRQSGDPVMPYHEYPADGSDTHWGGGNHLGSTFRGQTAMRIDKVDVTTFVGAPEAVITDLTDPPTGGGGPSGTSTIPVYVPPVTTPPPLTSSNECYNKYRNLCDPANELNQALCKLNPSFPFCKTGN